MKKETLHEANNRNLEELGLPPRGSAGSEQLLNAIPLIGLMRSLGQQGQEKERTSDPNFLRNTAGRGLETNYEHGAPWDTTGKDADIPMMAEGGVVPGEESASRDEVEVPEDVKEFVNQAHIARQESRPDEGWRMVGEKPSGDEIPYKRDEEDKETEAPAVMDEVPGFAEGGIVDPSDLMAQIAPAGTGTLVPSPVPDQNAEMDEWQRSVGVNGEGPGPEAPPAAPEPAPAMPAPGAPAPTDADYMAKANKLLGLDANQTASFMKMLGDRSQKAQLGAGIAGIGDAIASGGTLGKVNPGALNKSEDLISNRENAGISGMQTIRGNQKEAQELGDKLQSRDPNSPLSKYAQKAYAGVGKKIGLDLSHASAALIADVTGKGVDALNTELQNQLKLMNLDLQKKQLDAMTANQKDERAISRQGQQLSASEKLGSRTLGNKIEGIFPGTPAHAEKETLERIASGSQGAPFGQETVRNGKTYEWSQETGHYHLKR